MYLWILSTIVAYFIKGLCGFANTLVFTAILSFGVANVNISPIDLLLGYPANLILVWKNRKHLAVKVYLPLTVLVLIGDIMGAFLLKNVDTCTMKLIFGVIVILLGAEILLRACGKGQIHSSPLLLTMIGVAAGVLCGLFGVGALLAAYLSRVTERADALKANISAVFLADNIFRMILYGILHLFSLSTIKMVLFLIPFALLGLFIGIKSSAVLQERIVRKCTAVLLMISGISLILKNL